MSGRWAIAPAVLNSPTLVTTISASFMRTLTGAIAPLAAVSSPSACSPIPNWRGSQNKLEARRDGVEYRLAKMPMAEVLRTKTISEPRGLMKVLIAKNSDEILGFTAFGFEASEQMVAMQTAMLGHLPYTVLRDAVDPSHHGRGLERTAGRRSPAMKHAPRSKNVSSIDIVNAQNAVERVVPYEELTPLVPGGWAASHSCND